MKRMILTAAVVFLTVAVQAQQNRANKPKANTANNQAAETGQSAGQEVTQEKKQAAQESRDSEVKPTDKKAASQKKENVSEDQAGGVRTGQEGARGSRSQRGVQQETVMPDGNAAPASGGERQSAPATGSKAARRPAQSGASRGNNAAGAVQPAQPSASPSRSDNGGKAAQPAQKATPAQPAKPAQKNAAPKKSRASNTNAGETK